MKESQLTEWGRSLSRNSNELASYRDKGRSEISGADAMIMTALGIQAKALSVLFVHLAQQQNLNSEIGVDGYGDERRWRSSRLDKGEASE